MLLFSDWREAELSVSLRAFDDLSERFVVTEELMVARRFDARRVLFGAVSVTRCLHFLATPVKPCGSRERENGLDAAAARGGGHDLAR